MRISVDGRELAELVPARGLLGIAGAPGAGKSTLAQWLATAYGAVVVPLDGFHLDDVELRRRGLLDHKGAPETFDAEGYAALLRRLRERAVTGETVLAPTFDRVVEQPVAGAIAVPPEVPLVVTEGNYLLLDEPRWRAAREQLDAVWQVHTEPVLRRLRLVARHVRFGKSPEQAEAWVQRVDEPNAALVESVADRADVVLDLTEWAPVTSSQDGGTPSAAG